MGLGRRKQERQAEFWVATEALPEAPRHVFYDTLNRLREDGRFDDFVEELCEPYSAGSVGRPSIPPAVCFRMLLIGYFEGIDSQRGIAWRCSDSLSLRRFLQVPLDARTPDHSSLTRVRDRLPLEIHQQVFAFVLSLAGQHKPLGGMTPRAKTVAIDTTLREASAAMRSIVRKESGEEWKASLTRQMKEEGRIEEDDEPTDEELRTFDKGRKNKTVSNREWESASDSESRIAKMKDGRSGSGGAASDSGFAASESNAASPTPARLADVALRMREVQQALPTRRRSAEPGAADAEGRLFLLSARFFRLQSLAIHRNPRRTPPATKRHKRGVPGAVRKRRRP